MNFRSRPQWTCQGWMKLSGEGKNMAQDIQIYEGDGKSSDILCIIKRRQPHVQKYVPLMIFCSRPHWKCQGSTKLSGEGKI